MVSALLLILVPLLALLSLTRTVRSSISSLPISIVLVLVLLLIVITSLVSLSNSFASLNQKFFLAEMIKRELELHRLNTHSQNRVQMASNRLSNHVFRYGGYVGAHCIVGGVGCKGPQLIEVSNDGHSKAGPFLTMGSGSLQAMGIFETDYRENMTQDEAQALCVRAIEAGIYCDEGSGSNVDVCIIKANNKVDYKRGFKTDNGKMFAMPGGY